MGDSIVIDQMQQDDWGQVREIYLEGIATGNATFQNEDPSWEEWIVVILKSVVSLHA
ncbi:hypothetical protein [Bacillus sp. OV166]|uniref:hypothetical protein n=1 Tax=Bacillus sp. OV166 TaxID=1882763 RepID=UPI002688E24D|nr:hypothetical protein [Bacillus sp. OV166]